MIRKEILKKIRQIEIATRRLLSGSLVGDTRSAVKGSGFEFDQIREYQVGDDVRFIDWNSSSRMDKLLVKQYIQERNRTIILAVDVSASGLFSSGQLLKSEVVAEIVSVLSLVADYGRDAVSLILFSDEVQLFIPPGQGRQHVRHIMEKIFTYRAQSGARTSLKSVLAHIAKLGRNDAVVFLISDFIDTMQSGYVKLLSAVSHRYDCIAVRCLDRHEQVVPSSGLLCIEDPETGATCTIDTRGGLKSEVSQFVHARLSDQAALFKRSGIDIIDITIDRPFVSDLIRFFRRRMSY